jgi:hypothetical protein
MHFPQQISLFSIVQSVAKARQMSSAWGLLCLFLL